MSDECGTRTSWPPFPCPSLGAYRLCCQSMPSISRLRGTVHIASHPILRCCAHGGPSDSVVIGKFESERMSIAVAVAALSARRLLQTTKGTAPVGLTHHQRIVLVIVCSLRSIITTRHHVDTSSHRAYIVSRPPLPLLTRPPRHHNPHHHPQVTTCPPASSRESLPALPHPHPTPITALVITTREYLPYQSTHLEACRTLAPR